MVVHYGALRIVNSEKQYLPLKYFVGESVSPRQWNPRTCRVKECKAYPQYALLNERLQQLGNIAHSLLLQYKINGTCPTNQQLRDALDDELKKNNIHIHRKKKLSFLSFIEIYIEEMIGQKPRSTIIQYKNTLRLLQEFSKRYRRPLRFDDINLKFHTAFRVFMNTMSSSETYFGNQIRIIRLFMNEATDRGYNTQLSYKSRKFASPMPDLFKIYLTEDEISRIQKLDLSHDSKMMNVRDIFILGCRTGLRFSDLMRIQPVNINIKERLLKIETQKTKELVYVPLSPDVLDLCEQYKRMFPRITNGLFNFYIKKIGLLANINEEIEVRALQGGTVTYKVVKKYELISSHTARRSFATNAYLAHVPTVAIMRITGHHTEEAFMKYLRIASENNARQLLSHPHFLKPAQK
jgi:integrase